jgi:ATP-dependent DNA helicase RecG
VPEGKKKPYSTKGKFYIRYGANSQQLKREDIRHFFQEEELVLFDEKPNLDFNIKKDFNESNFKIFLEKTGISPVLKNKEILENLQLLKEGYIKNAGVLLFSKKITDFFLQATITCVLYRGKTKYKILDRKEYDGDIYSNYENAIIYLQSKLNTEFIIKSGPREEKLELPEEALREAILNAIAHRDYFVSGANILVEIYSDRVEITNPGGLVKGIRIEDLGKKSLSRNNLLFGLMQRMDLVEKVGSGIIRMHNAMKEYGFSGPEFDINDNWFTINFKRPKMQYYEESSELIRSKFGEGSEKSSEKILFLIRRNHSISAREIAEIIGISRRAVEKQVANLKKIGKLKRIGPAKGGYWEIVKNDK